MKKLLKRALSLSSAAVMLFTMSDIAVFPKSGVWLTADAETDLDYTYDKIDEDEDGIFDYIEILKGSENASEIVIPSEIEGLPVTSIAMEAFYNCSYLENITIPDSVTFIGRSAFYYCTNLKNVTLPDSITQISNDLFAFTNIETITIPDSVTSIGGGAFWNCDNLKSLTIPDSVTFIGNDAFLGCDSLKSITIPDSVTYIGSMAFNGCEALQSIVIPDSVTEVGEGLFYECSNLRDVVLSNSITSICSYYESDYTTYYRYGFFEKCESLERIIIPESVTNIEYDTLSGCGNLKAIYGAPGTAAEELAERRNIKFYDIYTDSWLSEISLELEIGEEKLLNVINYDGEIKWFSDDEDIVSVNNGLVKAVSDGNATIYAIAGGVVHSCSVTAGANPDAVMLSRTELNLEAGEEAELVVRNYNGKVSWFSDNEDIAYVSDGIVSAVSDGNTTVYAIAGDELLSCSVTVGAAPVTEPEVTTGKPDSTSVSSSVTTASTVTNPGTDGIKVPEGVTASMYGDANNDDTVNVADVVGINLFILNSERNKLTAEGTANADCVRDGVINTSDSIRLMNYVAEIIDIEYLGK